MTVSIIIRTFNEERWITPCLRSVFNQKHKDFEVIIVDNESSDKTLEKALQFDIEKIINCKNFKPGLALNMGIRDAKGEYIVCLSGHCIPVNNKWLSNLLRNFSDDKVAGVYGRQEPLAFTPDADKRDLSIIFGLDRKVQIKDSFFHNANSIIRKVIWDQIPFDEKTTNIEDRIWADKILHKGYKIIYEPEASVYHHHGIHHDGDRRRCVNVVNILQMLDNSMTNNIHLNVENLNIFAIIPVKGKIDYVNEKPLIGYTIKQALESKYIKKVFVSTDNPDLAKKAEAEGATVPFLRDESLSEDYVDTEKVLQYTLEKIENLKFYADLIVYLEVTFPFRPKGFIDEIIEQLINGGFDSVMAARKEFKSLWKGENGNIERIDEGNIPRKYKDPFYIGLKGLGTTTHPEFIRQGTLLGKKNGIYEVNSPLSCIEIREEKDMQIAERLLDNWVNDE